MRDRIVMIHLHHVREEAVGILTQQLGDDHLEDAQGVTHRNIINLQMIFVFYDTGSVHHLLLLDRPTETTEEVRNEVRRREIIGNDSITKHFECRQSP